MDYISRSTWGARHAAGTGPRPVPCSEAWLHHTVTRTLSVNATETEEREQMRIVERIGQNRFGAGFSYNLAIFPSGRVYVGCGVRRVGNHTGGRNTKALGIVLVGDFSAQPVSEPMRAALVEVLRDAKRLGWLKQARLNGGHRDLKPTGCPGDQAYRLIPGVNAEAQGAPEIAYQATPTPTISAATPTGQEAFAMFLCLDTNDHHVYLCDRDGASKIGGPESAALQAKGFPYLGKDTDKTARGEILTRRGVSL